MANGNTWTLVGALVGIVVIAAAIIIALIRINKARSTVTNSTEKDQLNFSYGTLIAATVVLLIVAILITITLFRRGKTAASRIRTADIGRRVSSFLS